MDLLCIETALWQTMSRGQTISRHWCENCANGDSEGEDWSNT